MVLGPADCTESSLQFSLLAQFAAISSSLTERPVGPLLQRGKVEQGRERLYKFYPSLGRQINQNKRDIFIQLSSLQVCIFRRFSYFEPLELNMVNLFMRKDADLFVNPPCASGNCFYHRSLSYSARPDTPPLWTSQRPGGAEYIPISHSELSSLMSNYAALNLSDPFALYVSVYGYKPADFTLSLTSSTTVQEWPEVGFVKVNCLLVKALIACRNIYKHTRAMSRKAATVTTNMSVPSLTRQCTLICCRLTEMRTLPSAAFWYELNS